MKLNQTLIVFICIALLTLLLWVLIGWAGIGVFRFFKPELFS